MKTHYFEFNQCIVDAGMMPSTLCVVYGREHDAGMFQVMALADRVYYVDGNTAYEIKNRNEETGRFFVSDEDKVVLKLKAVLI